MRPPRSSSKKPAPPMPAFKPQLATLVKAPPAGDDWLHEQKLDGYRIGCRFDGKAVRLISRTDHDWTDKFPSVREAALRLPVEQVLLDGEVAAVLPNGLTSFQALQNSFRGEGRANLCYFVFDLLFWNGRDIARQPLLERKALLKELLGGQSTTSVIRYSDHVIGDGAAFLSGACRMGMEGIVSKRQDQPYTPGRNAGWLKIKCIKRQELVIGGFTDPEGSRQGIGALLVGYYDDKKRLVYAGRVGTGFSERAAMDLRKQLDALEQKQPAFTAHQMIGPLKGIHWAVPRLVCEVAFSEWTDEGIMRHPSFQGLRLDKKPKDVVREVPG